MSVVDPTTPPPKGGLAWLERACAVIPALDAETTLAGVVTDLRRDIPEIEAAIFVVDDGSGDDTARIAGDLGCVVVRSHGGREAHGKGLALRAGFEAAAARKMTVALTVDADGQHPAEEARRVLFASANEGAFVLGVRDLLRDAAPRANRFSNAVSNYFLSRFARRRLHDTQCGLRRYPIERTLALGARGQGYDFEAEVILRALWADLDVVEVPVRVIYPEGRQTHFRVGRDPWRIIRTVVATVGERWLAAEDDLRREA